MTITDTKNKSDNSKMKNFIIHNTKDALNYTKLYFLRRFKINK